MQPALPLLGGMNRTVVDREDEILALNAALWAGLLLSTSVTRTPARDEELK